MQRSKTSYDLSTFYLFALFLLSAFPISVLGQQWYSDWGNNGSGQLNNSGWVVSNADWYLPRTNQTQITLVTINPSGGWAANLAYSPATSWGTVASNGGSLYIGSWHLSSNDKFCLTGAANNLLTANPGGGAMHHYIGTGNWWVTDWSNGGNGYIGIWHLASQDQFIEYGTDKKLFAVNTANGWAALLQFSGSGWTTIWSNNGNGWIGAGNSNGWHIGSADRYVAGSFGGTAKLLAISPGGWAMLLTFTGSLWSPVRDNGGNGWIGGWHTGGEDKYTRGDYDATSRDKVLALNYNNHWATLLDFTGSSWSSLGATEETDISTAGTFRVQTNT